MSVAVDARVTSAIRPPASAKAKSAYPNWFYLPAAIVFGVLFLFPTIASLFFSLTRWTLFEAQFIGFDNFVPYEAELLRYAARHNLIS